eukprot:Amastigsp_a677563_49.p2 type:complete len:148 gc:universal Amastigsp_a677563_49:623-1066(+)
MDSPTRPMRRHGAWSTCGAVSTLARRAPRSSSPCSATGGASTASQTRKGDSAASITTAPSAPRFRADKSNTRSRRTLALLSLSSTKRGRRRRRRRGLGERIRRRRRPGALCFLADGHDARTEIVGSARNAELRRCGSIASAPSRRLL